jgi:hypothetical protein
VQREVEVWQQDGKTYFQVEGLEGYRFNISQSVNEFEETVWEVFVEGDKFCNVYEVDPQVFEAWTPGNLWTSRQAETPVIAVAKLACLYF